jgi:hypothetical protein
LVANTSDNVNIAAAIVCGVTSVEFAKPPYGHANRLMGVHCHRLTKAL